MLNWIDYQLKKLTRPDTVRCGNAVLHLGDLARTSYARSIYRDTHECEERSVIQRHLTPDDRVLEFGTGLGLVTVLCCQVVGAENVTTYEANPRMEPLLRRTFELNDVQPDLRMKMVSISDQDSTFFVSDRFVVSSRIRHDAAASEMQIPSDSFQSVLQEVRPTFLIMDIEGSEVDLVDEAIDLSCLQKICVEVHPQIAGDEATSQLVRSLMNRGFDLHLTSCEGDVLYFQRSAASVEQVEQQAA